MGRKRKILPLLRDIEIDAMGAEGKAVAKVEIPDSDSERVVVFVPYAAPGDVADLQIDKRKRNYWEGHIAELHRPGACRVEPACRHFGECGGCKWQHVTYAAQMAAKQRQVEDSLRRIGHLELPEVSPIKGSERIFAYRNKMEYTFSDKKWRSWADVKSGREFTDSPNALGFHIPGAFDKVLHIEECLLQDDLGNRLRNWIYAHAEQQGLRFYDLRTNSGLLRSLMIRITSLGQVMVCIQFGADEPEVIAAFMQALGDAFPEITSLLYVVNLKANDTIGDQEVIAVRGNDYIEEEMEGLRFRINAKSFYQTNSLQAYELYKVVRDFAFRDLDGARPLVYDLYTGAGTIANFVASRARKVIGIEYVEQAIEDARLNSRVNGIGNTLFYAGDMKDVLTDDFVAEHGVPDVMIVDPPRAGMHADVVKTILNANPSVVVYVSCNPATQARDLAMMSDRYRITDVQPVDMFPHTHHVENVVRMVRREDDSE